MTTPLFDPPTTHSLPVSWHADLVVDFQNYDPDDTTTTIDYEAGTHAYLDIKTDPVTRVEAQITGFHAVCRVESDVTDTLRTGTLWVFLLSLPGDPTTEVPVVNGVVERFDGKPKA